MRSQKNKIKKRKKTQVSSSEPFKLRLNSQIRNSLNSRPEINPKAQHLKN